MTTVVILAAGSGTRLSPLTDNKPKCLVPLLGKPLLEWHLEALREAGVENLVVVRGYCGEQISYPGVTYVDNNSYATTNMVYSLWCARDYFGDDITLAYGDIVYNPAVMRKVIESPYDISVVADRGWLSYWQQRFDDPLSDAETFRYNAQGSITELGQEPKSVDEIQAQYIGLVRFSGRGVAILKETLDAEEKASRKGKSTLCSERNFNRLYITDLLQGMIDRGQAVHPVFIDRGWIEVDSPTDLKLASRLASADGNWIEIKI